MWQHLENRVEWGLWDLELMSVVMGDEVVDLGEVLLVINQSSQRAYSLTFMIDVIYKTCYLLYTVQSEHI